MARIYANAQTKVIEQVVITTWPTVALLHIREHLNMWDAVIIKLWENVIECLGQWCEKT